MSDWTLWGIIVGGMVVTYGTRLSFIVLVPPERMPNLLRRGLRYVPSAILAALILPELVRPGGTLDLSLHNGRLVAGAIAALAAWRFRNTWITIVAGMLALWLLSVG